MAKKQEMTIEQRLEEALVLYEKTPYKLPSNWCWVKLPVLYENVTSSDKKIPQKNYLQEGVYSIIDQGKDLVGGYTNDKKYIYDGELPVIIFGDHTRTVKYVDFEFTQGADGVKVLKPSKSIMPKYLYYCIKNLNMVDLGYRRHFPLFPKYYAPLAPLEEQKRIVDIIEKQFAKLDEARDLIQKSLDSFADRKSAILYKAFTGELTKLWRENKNLKWDNNFVGFLECIEDMQNGFSKRKGIEGSECIVLRLADLKDNDISLIDSRTIKLTNKEIEKYQLRNDDIIMIRVNGSKDNVGRQILFNLNCCCAYCDHIIRIRYKNDINPKYMMYFAQSKKYKEYIQQNLVCSAGQNTISRKGLSRLQVVLPSIEEQEEIVRILDSIFEKEDKSKELIDMLDKIDEMKKSILTRAFRGELGTSNPSDEPAIELLKSILESQVSVTERTKNIKRKTNAGLAFSHQLSKRQWKICELLIQSKGLSIDKIAQGVGKDVIYLFDDLRELIDKHMIELLDDNRYVINADNAVKNK